MTTRKSIPVEEKTMKRTTHTLTLGLALAAVVGAMTFASTASARVPVEPGYGSPVTYKHPRKPAVKRTIRRYTGGFPATGHNHVRSTFAPDDQ
jgi:hypothetical protein